MISDDAVRDTFAMVMGREDLTPEVIARHRRFDSPRALARHLMRSDAFVRQAATHAPGTLRAPIDPKRPVTVFQHIPKAGGTSLHMALEQALNDKAFAERRNGLGNWPAAALAEARFFSGHFDTASLALIPACDLRVVTVLRDPVDRLVSMYRYLRSIQPGAARAQQRNMKLTDMARQLEPADFFAAPELAGHPSLDNAMTRQLAGVLGQKSWESYHGPCPDRLRGAAATDVLARATAHLDGMAAFGLLDRPHTLPPLFAALGLPVPDALPRENVTDSAHVLGTWFDPPVTVEVDDKLRTALASHVEIDAQLHYAAVQILTRRGIL